MKKKLLFIGIIMIFSIIVFYNSKHSEKPLNNLLLSNIEALASSETDDEFTGSTGCIAVIEYVTCRGKDGLLYSYARKP